MMGNEAAALVSAALAQQERMRMFPIRDTP